MFVMALVAVMLGFAMSACSDDDNDHLKELEKEYSRLIVGQWFDFTPEASMFMNYQADGSFYMVGYGSINGWREYVGTYKIDKNKAILDISGMATPKLVEIDEITNDRFVQDGGLHTSYRVKKQFDITGKYTYLNSAVRVVAAAGKTALQLPEGVLFQGQNYIPVDAMHGDRIIDVMKKFFANATFAADGKLNHTLEGETKVKNYTLKGNNLVFNLYEGSDTYKVNATSFPDEDGDRLFIIIPKQAAWLGGMVDLVEKENEGLKLDAAQIAALEKEFMDTFETFTVILSLSKK
jgi:hypothetical protein